MNEEPTPEQIAKLPRWAQDHIKDLASERAVAIRALNEYLDTKTPTEIYYQNYESTGEERIATKGKSNGPSSKRCYLQTRNIEIKSGGVLLRVSCHDSDTMHEPGIELCWSDSNERGDHVALIPRSFQSMSLVAHPNMKVWQKPWPQHVRAPINTDSK